MESSLSGNTGPVAQLTAALSSVGTPAGRFPQSRTPPFSAVDRARLRTRLRVAPPRALRADPLLNVLLRRKTTFSAIV